MGKNYAIIVGVNIYDNLSPLKYAKNDAQSVGKLFHQLNFEEVYVFTHDADPISGTNGLSFPADPIYGRIKNFLDKRFDLRHEAWLEQSDNLWFFFAGHGLRYENRDYLLLQDSNPENPAESALSVQDLAIKFRTSSAGNIILLLDACRNNGGRSGLGVNQTCHQGIITFYSCAPNQTSYEIEELASGAFTYSLLRGLKGEASNCATVKRFDAHLKEEVSRLVYQYKNYSQDPQLSVDPESKRDVILLPGKHEDSDLDKLRYHAALAESEHDYLTAHSYWLQILSFEFDSQAIKAISRLAQQIDQPKSVPVDNYQSSNSGYSASTKSASSLPRKLSATVPNQARRKIDYERLTALLKIKQWNLADEETWKLILKMSYREKDGWIRVSDIEKISCHDLYQLDYLWKCSSAGKFGLSAQCSQYIECGLVSSSSFNMGIWEDFGDAVGWRQNGYWIENSDIISLNQSNVGHLPAIGVYVTLRSSATNTGKLMHALFLKILECNVIDFNTSQK
jgi:uncharacterized caspase-like protein